jgi:hypothetical protein
MKNIQTFEEFLNEGTLLEKKTFSPANVKEYGLNKKSVDALKSWKFKIDDMVASFQDSEYWGNKPDLFFFMNGQMEWMLSGFVVNIAGIPIGLKMDASENTSKIEFDAYYTRMDIDFKKSEYLQHIEGNEDSVLAFIDLLNYAFTKYEKEISAFVKGKLSLETLYVIDAGKISPSSGKNGHGWSIYDHPKAFMGFTKSSDVIWSSGELKVGDKFKIVNDQNHKVISDEVVITDVINANYRDFVAISKKRGANIPVGSFQKQPGRFQFTLLSVK